MCKVSSKIFLLVTGVLFWAAAAVLIGIGSYTIYEFSDYKTVSEHAHVLIPASIFIAVGVFLIILGAVGIVGAWKEQKCLLGFFFIILMLIFLGLIAASILSFMYKDQAHGKIDEYFKHALDRYGRDDAVTDDMDFIQKTLHCCGNNNYTEWEDTWWYHNQNTTVENTTVPWPYPNSCCAHDKCDYDNQNGTGVFENGCAKKIHDVTTSHLKVLFGVAVGLAVFQLIGMIASCVLLCRRRAEVPYIGLVEPSGMRV